MKIQELLARPIHPLQSKYPIIANIYLSFILVEHYFSPFWQKEIKKILSHYLAPEGANSPTPLLPSSWWKPSCTLQTGKCNNWYWYWQTSPSFPLGESLVHFPNWNRQHIHTGPDRSDWHELGFRDDLGFREHNSDNGFATEFCFLRVICMQPPSLRDRTMDSSFLSI